MSIVTPIIVVLILILIYQIQVSYLSELREWCQDIEWNQRDAKDLLQILSMKYGPPEPVSTEPGGMAVWKRGEADIPFQRIILSDAPRCLSVSMPLQFFSDIQNTLIYPQAYQAMLEDIFKLSHISCNGRQFTIHTDSWSRALATATLLTKLTKPTLTLKEIKEGNLMNEYIKKCVENGERYEEKINTYVRRIKK
jgi:hypothetical protein